MLFTIYERYIRRADPDDMADVSGHLYVISGRIPFDDDDTAMVILAMDEEKAINAYTNAMYDGDPPPDGFENEEPAIYLNQTIDLGVPV